MHCVYIHTVLANGKKYVGQCNGDPQKRWGIKWHRYKGQLFYSAIKKYGWNNMTHEIIRNNLSQIEADELEKYLIKKYRSNEREFGYNITSGGKDGAGLPGGKNHNAKPVVCIETGREWECANYCARELGVNCASLQESLYNGYKCKGFHFRYVEDSNYKINKEPHMIKCLDTGEIWNNAKECAESLGVDKRSVFRYCAGTRKPKNGYSYVYVA